MFTEQFLQKFPQKVNDISFFIARKTERFIKTPFGKAFVSLMILGPVAFLPTVWNIWTASNIDNYRNPTWPLMFFVNLATVISVAHKGDWIIRLVMFLWQIIWLVINIALIIR